jgi:hypothetical protein
MSQWCGFLSRTINKRGHQVIAKKSNKMAQDKEKAPSKYKNTKYFREPLFAISNSLTGERIAIIGAGSPDQAVEYAKRLRNEREITLPKEIAAEYLPSGPISSLGAGSTGACSAGVGFWSASYFQYLDSLLQMLDLGELVCPTCGR